MMLNVALIGLGNIALLYDYDKKIKSSLSHAKGIYLHASFTLKYCVDIDRTNESKVKELFPKVSFETNIDILIEKKDIDILVIATPTKTHYEILEKLKKNRDIKIFFIEKPLFEDLSDFKKIDEELKNKILINYIRNFEPNIIKLKSKLEEEFEILDKIIFYYTKGFKNNASHFISLINFLFDTASYNDSKIITKTEGLENDPTYDIFLELNYKNKIIPIQIIGLNHNNYAVFNIEFYFKNKKLVLDDVDKSLKSHNVIRHEDYKDYKIINSKYTNLDLEYDNIMYYAYDYIKQIIEAQTKTKSYDLEKRNNKLYVEILKKG